MIAWSTLRPLEKSGSLSNALSAVATMWNRYNKAINLRQQAGWELRLLRSRRPVIAALEHHPSH
tara:strand:+ start:743 stop:934 length:192 start_codon:yes stop_codon:yes gene_type:complete